MGLQERRGIIETPFGIRRSRELVGNGAIPLGSTGSPEAAASTRREFRNEHGSAPGNFVWHKALLLAFK
jgi:hypothetical protein